MKRTAAVACVLLVLTACTAPSSVQPGDGPAADPPSSSYSGPVEGEPSTDQEPTDEPTDQTLTASFKQKVVYPDGVEVEVTRIKLAKITAAEAEDGFEGEDAGDPYALLTIRIRNGSKQTLDTLVSPTVTYGPDGEEAESLYGPAGAGESISGKLVLGKSKSADYAYAIPEKYQDDVVMEVGPDYEHGSAVFTGSLR